MSDEQKGEVACYLVVGAVTGAALFGIVGAVVGALAAVLLARLQQLRGIGSKER